MNTPVTPLAPRTPVSPIDASEELDQLMQEYLVWSAEALDVLVALYEAVDSGANAPAEAGDFATRIGSWEDRLTGVLKQLGSRAPAIGVRRAAAFG